MRKKKSSKADSLHTHLSRRESQIMDIIYQRGRATASEVLDNLPDPPSYSAVRALLRILEEKDQLQHVQDGPRYVYYPVLSRDKAKRSALRHLLQTFFDNSTEQAVAALLDIGETDLSDDQLDRLASMIDRAKREGH